MSAHYNLLLSLPLNISSAVEHSSVLEFVLNKNSSQPANFPNHPFFEKFNPIYRFHNSYKGIVSGAWKSEAWLEKAPNGNVCNAGVNLCLPGNKLEGVWQDTLPLIHWLASMSSAQGAVGIVVAEDLSEDEPMVLFVRRSKLFISTSKHEELYNFDDALS
ncbi:hypothetical protein [Marinobacterium mangrovicola]|uniref:Uncharacterized protein n=1 Tax=Marinobacterium mangrovicola TaxID=1476959 RepID=A0A4R1GN82_9GAMM|nr:hypothetical protein [Marinobacterium mangrovicola]TCK08650.1 hypothetical protein CLV83_0741 [Marinobacterium mangrovicola]